MPISTVETEMGHLATLHHQRAIKRLIVGLDRLNREGKTNLEPLPETDIDPGNPESKCPDVIMRDNELLVVPVIIEVATHLGCRTDFKKMRSLVDETEYGIVEGFVYDFQSDTWMKYSREHGVATENPSWSEVLAVDLRQVL